MTNFIFKNCSTNFKYFLTNFHLTNSIRLSSRKIINTQKRRETRTMNKFITKENPQKKRKWYSLLPDTSIFQQKAPSSGSVKRAQQLSVIIYRHISNLVHSGDVDPKMAEYNIEISEVRVLPDFSNVVVTWLPTGTENDAIIEDLLNQNRFKLRSALIKLYIMGNLPQLQFKRDKVQSRVIEVESLMNKADFGPGYTPINRASSLQQPASTGVGDNNYLNNKKDSNSSINSVEMGLNQSYSSKIINISHVKTDLPESPELVSTQTNKPVHDTDLNSYETDTNQNDYSTQTNISTNVYGLDRGVLLQNVIKNKKILHDRSLRDKTDQDNHLSDKGDYIDKLTNVRGEKVPSAQLRKNYKPKTGPRNPLSPHEILHKDN